MHCSCTRLAIMLHSEVTLRMDIHLKPGLRWMSMPSVTSLCSMIASLVQQQCIIICLLRGQKYSPCAAWFQALRNSMPVESCMLTCRRMFAVLTVFVHPLPATVLHNYSLCNVIVHCCRKYAGAVWRHAGAMQQYTGPVQQKTWPCGVICWP